MKPILGRNGVNKLREFSTPGTALVLDYDGTICPIVPRAADAILPAKTARLLKRVARLYPTAVLSGRKLSDISARVRGCGVREVVGNHGLEWRGSPLLARYEKLMSRCLNQIQASIREGTLHGSGLEIEYKKVTLSVHYRMAPNRGRSRREIQALLRGLSGTQIIEGKCVFNLLPDTRLNKGSAVLALKKKFRCTRVIFAGDDYTDEKAFELRPKPFLLDVRVGRSTRSSARYYLPNIEAMHVFLEELIRLRKERGAD